MADKNTRLSIEIATVDKATAKIRAINERLDKITKPTRDFGKALSDLGEKSGLAGVVDGFKGVGSAVEGVLSKLAIAGGVAGLAVHGLLGLVEGFDDLGKKAVRLGVGVDFLAQMRDAAERTGVPVEELDGSLQTFSQNLGQARANTGRLASFLEKVSPALLKQVQAAKSNEEAFDLMAQAMTKVQDPAKRAALAQKAFGDSSLAPLLAKGAQGVKALREQYAQHAGSLEEAAKKSAEAGDAMRDLHASIDGVKAGLVVGLAPALTQVTDKLTKWFDGHRGAIAEWAKTIGEKLPGALQEVVAWLGKAYDKVSAFVDRIGGLKTVAYAAGAAIFAGPVVSLLSLGGALVKVIGRVGQLGDSFAGAGGKAGAFGSSLVALSGIGTALGIAEGLNQATGGPIEGGAFGIAKRAYDAEHATPTATGLLGPELRQALFGGVPQTSAKVTVDFKNLPPGARVTADPKNTADVDLTAGYQLAGSW